MITDTYTSALIIALAFISLIWGIMIMYLDKRIQKIEQKLWKKDYLGK